MKISLVSLQILTSVINELETSLAKFQMRSIRHHPILCVFSTLRDILNTWENVHVVIS